MVKVGLYISTIRSVPILWASSVNRDMKCCSGKHVLSRIGVKDVWRFEIRNVGAKYSHTIREVTAIRDRLVVASSAASAS